MAGADPVSSDNSRSVLIGLTGVVGSGKSTALRVLSDEGIPTCSSDDVVRSLYCEREIQENLQSKFGDSVLTDGEINRARLSSLVMNSESNLSWLERMIWPKVASRIFTWAKKVFAEGARVAVVEVPLLFEAQFDQNFDRTIAIVADQEKLDARNAKRRISDLNARLQRQWSQEKKMQSADAVVENNGSMVELKRNLLQVIDNFLNEEELED